MPLGIVLFILFIMALLLLPFFVQLRGPSWIAKPTQKNTRLPEGERASIVIDGIH
jgi:hypothetical protein